jgi:hypothetical protein
VANVAKPAALSHQVYVESDEKLRHTKERHPGPDAAGGGSKRFRKGSVSGYKRLTQVEVGSTVLRSFMYDTNTLDSTFSGSYTQGRLVAVQNQIFTPQGYAPGNGGSNITVPSPMQFVEMYAYTVSIT